MQQELIRLLRAEEIECRVAVIKENGLSLLLYKDARVDQRILDETFGIYGWQRKHETIDGNLYCTVSVRDKETGEWISKQDVGTSGYSEQEKSQASDSFKRACVNIGIGRELYSAPFIWISADKADIQRRDNKFCCYDRFKVADITYNGNREITGVVIVNERGKTVYTWGQKSGTEKTPAPNTTDGTKSAVKEQPAEKTAEKTVEKTVEKPQSNKLTQSQLTSLERELDRTGIDAIQVTERYKISDIRTMSDETYQKVMRALKRTSSRKDVA